MEAVEMDPEKPPPGEPDYRYTLANERTYLAWIRTALGILALAVAVTQVAPSIPIGLRVAIGAILVSLAIAISIASYREWIDRQQRMRLGQPIPRSILLPIITSALLVLGILAGIALAFANG